MRREHDAAQWPTGRSSDGYGFWFDFHLVPLRAAGWNIARFQVYRDAPHTTVALFARSPRRSRTESRP